MAYLPKQLAQSCVASTTETTVYTVPTGSSCIVKQIVIANVTGSAATTSLSIVASGGTAGDTNRAYKDLSIPANSVTTLDVSQVMASGGFISVKQGTASAITTTISGVEFGSIAAVKDAASSTRTSGDVTLNSTTWANVDTGMDLTLAAAAGDVIEVGLAVLLSSAATTVFFDAATLVSSSPVNMVSNAAAPNNAYEGVAAWYCVTGVISPQGSSVLYTVQSGDVSSGTVTLRLRYRTGSATNRNLNATADQPLQFWAINHGIAAADSDARPAVRVYNSAAISCATSGTDQLLTFDSERYDTGMHSTSSNTSRLTATNAGNHSIGASVTFAANATGARGIMLRVNGATVIALVRVPAVGAGDVTALTISTDYALAVGDYVEVLAYQTSGGALNVTAGSNYSPEFWMHRTGA